MKGWMYILECSDGSYYTGSTNNLELRMTQHQEGKGANHTQKRLPVTLVYVEEFQRIDEAFYREKQIQGWSRKKKEALISGQSNMLPQLAMAYRDLNKVVSSATKKNVVSRTSTTTHQSLPEALEGNGINVVSRTSTTMHQSLPEALEALPEALEGNDTESIKELI